jgi:class 3 adenylate cyclase
VNHYENHMIHVPFPSGTVTFIFTDIEKSALLLEKHSEPVKSALSKHDFILKDAAEPSNGQFIKTTGEGIHTVFSTASDIIAPRN